MRFSTEPGPHHERRQQRRFLAPGGTESLLTRRWRRQSPLDLRWVSGAGSGNSTGPGAEAFEAEPWPLGIFGALLREFRFARDSPLEEAVSSEPVSESPKFPASRDCTGNFIASGPAPRRVYDSKIAPLNQNPTSQFPRHPNREFFAALQAI